MEVRNCKNCGKMFNYIGKPICPGCEKALEEKFQVVKQFIKDNPNASINEVAEENEVSVNQIKRWVREERLTFSESSMVGLECESCGTMIRTGRFCEACKQKLGNSLNSLIEKPKPTEPERKKKEAARMWFLDN
ncbi:MAG: flagellar protein [Lachnospiraceae bacterium]|nr:flagellar protein [Lachnospiraceae bacterium]